MAPRRPPVNSNSLSPLDPTLAPGSPSSPVVSNFPRSASPSSGITQFLSKPSRWFTRSASASKASAGISEPRSSTSSTRKHKISRPTDPRPILDGYNAAGASLSVLDLSQRTPRSVESGHSPSTPSSPTVASLGDLRSISRKGWSKSADDLSKITPSNFSSSNPAFHDKVLQYRGRSDSAASAASPSSPSSVTGINIGRLHPFPTTSPPQQQPHLSASPPRSATLPTVSISVSGPASDEIPLVKSPSPTHAHTRSHSFTPKLSSKLATPRFLPPSPKRKGSSASEREVDMRDNNSVEKQQPQHGTYIHPPPSPGARSGFPFGLPGKSAVPDHGNSGGVGGHTYGHAMAGGNTFAGGITRAGVAAAAAAAAAKAAHHRTTTTSSLLAPPTIIEPTRDADLQLHDSSTDAKRSSQIVYYSGFINRLADSSANNLQHVNLSSAKSWKPFKMELKGSKLYFYKPPNDRAAAIKQLFPTSCVPPSLEDEEEVEAESPAGTDEPESFRRRGEGSTLGRKKRAFWGRRMHPELVTGEGGIAEKGTFEALVHEAVFATTFPPPEPITPVDGDDESPEANDFTHMRRSQEWREFASSVILSLPPLVGYAKFETEFLRCCSYLVSGAADDTARREERVHVTWLVMEYLRYHGAPVDLGDGGSAWEEWRRETLPGVELVGLLGGCGGLNAQAGMPSSDSMQALYVPSPLIGVGSPNFNTFSPRPEEGTKVVSLAQALEGFSVESGQIHQSPVHSPVLMPVTPKKPSLDFRTLEQQQQQQQQHPSFAGGSMGRVPWTALDKEGLSRGVLLAIDPHILAHSLTLYHRTVLEHVPDNITAASVIPPAVDPVSHEAEFDSHMMRPLYGTDDQPHWLTKLLLLQILGNDTSTGQVAAAVAANVNMGYLASPARRSEDRSGAAGPGGGGQAQAQQTSRTHSRSEVISVWAKVGELCRTAGDEVSWRAIVAALCSRPVARLDKVWKRVDPQALAAIESWVHPNEEGELVGVGEPRSTPWGGDVKARIKDELDKARDEEGSGDVLFKAGPLGKARVVFERFRTAFVLCPRKTYVVDGELDADVKRMVAYWREMALEGGGVGGLAAKLQRVDQFMSLSLAAEPRRKGLFEPYFWSRHHHLSSSPMPNQSLFPLLFPEPLPSVHFLDRAQLLRGRVDSDVSSTDVFGHGHGRAGEGQRGQGQASRNRDILSQGGTVIPVYNGELFLVVQRSIPVESAPSSRPSSFAPSRPPSSVYDSSVTQEKSVSRSPSIRVKPGSSQNLERKASMAKRSSLPSLSQRPNFVMSEPSTLSNPPLRVVVQSGTLNMLVRILVHGLPGVSVSVADDNGEMSLREGIARELVLDRNEFARVWWNVFRSFVTPFVFFELLRKLYISSQPPGSMLSVNDYLLLADDRGQILGTIREWLTVGGGAQDVLDDMQLYAAVRGFLDSDPDAESYETLADPAVVQAMEGLKENRVLLASLFGAQMMRPRSAVVVMSSLVQSSQLRRIKSGVLGVGGGGTKMRHVHAAATAVGGREPPDIDRIDPEEFVDNLDGMMAAAFSNVAEEDLYIMADLLEVQTADRTGWFSHREVSTVEEVVEIQSMYSHLQEIEPSSLIAELGHESLYRLLPPGIRSCIRAYGILRKWLISKIITPRLGLRARQMRMEFLLQVLEVARLRSLEPGSCDPSQLAVQACVRSFVEAVVSSALISVESRIHQRAWQNIALGRGVVCDSLVALLSRPYTERTSGHEVLTMDMGWLVERMLEIIVMPDIVETGEGQSLVNFDKRRQLHHLISQAPSLLPLAKRHGHSDEVNRRGFERLSHVEKEVVHLQFDPRGIKEEAAREALHATTGGGSGGSGGGVGGGNQSAKKAIRPFHKTVAAQMEKNRRDKNLRTRLQKEKLQEQARVEKRDDILNRAMRSRKPPPVAQKQHRNKKSMSAFLNFMRPLSSAFGADAFHQLSSSSAVGASSGLKRTASELDFKSTGKPTLVLSLMDAHVAQFINNERSYTFKLDTEDGGHYLLQGLNRKEMVKWLEVIARVAKMATKRRLTYLGNSPKPMLADHLHVEPIATSRDPVAVFGMELEYLLQREAGGGVVQPGTVPLIIEQCLSEIEARGLTEVGIYRIAGATSEINALKDAYNRGEYPIRPDTDIHAVCDVVKSWFRVLPEPVFLASSYHQIMQKMQLENLEERLAGIRSVVQGLPQANFDLLKRVSEHLDKVTDYEEHNQMTAEALAIVFGPNLLRAPQNDFVMILANMGHTHKLVKALITHYHVIFDDVDPEAEVHSEDDDFDAPIIEEDEEEEDDGPLHASDDLLNEHATSEQQDS
ncbi:hypothetical protein AMATHDRAFT_5377 [Amanita thiersii Skay4041]|uniref:Rho-GAP domain-containing protein n=1 Tax=Amanita thiersii Skay4041 TaxID=703135 RepID=A0A2A9NKW6_9AGAR|nr:hypothetical protein AMATHDRAFT_5377 [Amanita thiersii Skay4041]